MQGYGQQAAPRRLNVLFAKAPGLLQTYHPLAKLVVVGLLAIGISGAACGLIAWGFGRSAVAGDTLSAWMTPYRCAQLLEDHEGAIFDFAPGTTRVPGDECGPGELIDHTDEIVSFRIVAGAMALIASLGYISMRRRWFSEAKESRGIQRVGLLLGFGAFGLAAAVLLSIALRNAAIDGDTAGLGRWLADGFVALAFCLIYGVLALRELRRGSTV